jgi:deazaflavin-dependent oxidoreductase (nitroreductase family)
MADVFLYLTTIGRKSGLPRRIEIWFVEYGSCHYIVAEMRERAGWVKNLEREPRVTFSVGTRERPNSAVPDMPARARIVEAAAEPELAGCVSVLMDAKYGWSDGLIVEIGQER